MPEPWLPALLWQSAYQSPQTVFSFPQAERQAAPSVLPWTVYPPKALPCEENLQDALDLVEDYGKDCYVLVVTWDDVKGADSVEVPENVKKITFNGW